MSLLNPRQMCSQTQTTRRRRREPEQKHPPPCKECETKLEPPCCCVRRLWSLCSFISKRSVSAENKTGSSIITAECAHVILGPHTKELLNISELTRFGNETISCPTILFLNFFQTMPPPLLDQHLLLKTGWLTSDPRGTFPIFFQM